MLWTHPTCPRIFQVRSTGCSSSFSAVICAWLHEVREKTHYSFPGASYATSLLKGKRKAPSFLFFPCQYPIISSSFYWRRDTGNLLSRYFWGAHGVSWVLRHVSESRAVLSCLLQRLALDQFAACLVAVMSDTDHFTTGPHPSWNSLMVPDGAACRWLLLPFSAVFSVVKQMYCSWTLWQIQIDDCYAECLGKHTEIISLLWMITCVPSASSSSVSGCCCVVIIGGGEGSREFNV